MNELTTCTTTTRRQTIYEYKGKPYTIVCQSKVKHEETWKDVIIYRCEYPNPDGTIWVRFLDEFFILFKERE